ncbi:ectomycorrhiza-regulated protein [Moniliophthora roreri MCA 2997]|uniref:Ectomycorrhiza-regulated protein n=1 Tax=Moniliophthora roreri (strain MCA 2997) TaxID=1381753 RepID=V2XHN0_MONRO|nr:ectomycorrhiza-regulated protein [Moniliophthora roreri MCA 2997]
MNPSQFSFNPEHSGSSGFNPEQSMEPSAYLDQPFRHSEVTDDEQGLSSTGMSMLAGPSTQVLHSQHPSLQATFSSTPAAHRRRSPDTLLPLDAPVQPRHYATPSATSRKEIPSYYLKRRPQTQVSDEEDDELTEELPPNATDQEKIEHRRHKNTIAARRSRRRKVVYQQQLEDLVERLTIEKEQWKTRAQMLRQIAESRGIACPDWEDE